MILKLLGKKNTQENPINRIAVGIFLHPLQMQFDVAQARRACERKAGGQARSYPSRSPEIEGPGTHTHLGNVLLHTHHLFSHPFARDYGTTPH
jgi:hypothetical protein